jgi:IQ calmodulin-binding motif
MILDHLLEYMRKQLFYYLFKIKFFCSEVLMKSIKKYSKSTLNRAATCIQRWWRGFILRHRWNYLKKEVCFYLIFIFFFN